MKTLRRLRYYCDHCKKSGGSKHHMVNHEAGCTGNPDRVCGLCKISDEGVQMPMAALVEASHNGINALRTAASGCPACMLAAIRQRLSEWDATMRREEELSANLSELMAWEYKPERDSWWKEFNAGREHHMDW